MQALSLNQNINRQPKRTYTQTLPSPCRLEALYLSTPKTLNSKASAKPKTPKPPDHFGVKRVEEGPTPHPTGGGASWTIDHGGGGRGARDQRWSRAPRPVVGVLGFWV